MQGNGRKMFLLTRIDFILILVFTRH